jgi:nuclease S1
VTSSRSQVCRFVFGLLVFGALGLSALAPSASAWGCKGHQTVAYLAEKHLTPEARKLVNDLLAAHPIDPRLKRWCGNDIYDLMADAATWADDVRAQPALAPDRNTGPWHYIDIPRQAKNGPLAPYCGNQGCVTQAIAEQIAILKDKSADAAKRADALRYLIHFVGDLHQPMHAVDNDDEGGNCVPLQYFRADPRLNMRHPELEEYSPNLHSIWDTAIVERDMEVGDPRRYADDLDKKFAAEMAGWEKAGIHVDDWAWESHDAANQVAYSALPVAIAMETPMKVTSCAGDNDIGGRMLAKHIVVGEAYQEAAAKVVEQRLAQAGVRLAMILNEAAKAQ